MTKKQKLIRLSCFQVLLCFILLLKFNNGFSAQKTSLQSISKSVQLARLKSLVQVSPNTNTYGCAIGWTINDPFVQSTRVYWGRNPGPPWMGTNEFGDRTNYAMLRLPVTNEVYWIAATSFQGSSESDMVFLTKTNYVRFSLLDTVSRVEMTGFTLTNPTQQVQLFKANATQSNNWSKLP